MGPFWSSLRRGGRGDLGCRRCRGGRLDLGRLPAPVVLLVLRGLVRREGRLFRYPYPADLPVPDRPVGRLDLRHRPSPEGQAARWRQHCRGCRRCHPRPPALSLRRCRPVRAGRVDLPRSRRLPVDRGCRSCRVVRGAQRCHERRGFRQCRACHPCPVFPECRGFRQRPAGRVRLSRQSPRSRRPHHPCPVAPALPAFRPPPVVLPVHEALCRHRHHRCHRCRRCPVVLGDRAPSKLHPADRAAPDHRPSLTNPAVRVAPDRRLPPAGRCRLLGRGRQRAQRLREGRRCREVHACSSPHPADLLPPEVLERLYCHPCRVVLQDLGRLPLHRFPEGPGDREVRAAHQSRCQSQGGRVVLPRREVLQDPAHHPNRQGRRVLGCRVCRPCRVCLLVLSLPPRHQRHQRRVVRPVHEDRDCHRFRPHPEGRDHRGCRLLRVGRAGLVVLSCRGCRPCRQLRQDREGRLRSKPLRVAPVDLPRRRCRRCRAGRLHLVCHQHQTGRAGREGRGRLGRHRLPVYLRLRGRRGCRRCRPRRAVLPVRVRRGRRVVPPGQRRRLIRPCPLVRDCPPRPEGQLRRAVLVRRQPR